MVKMTTLTFLFLLIICFSEVDRARGYGDPCSNYRKLSRPDRAAGFNKLTKKSDKRNSWKEVWYRFMGKAGDKLAALNPNGGSCPKSPACGAVSPAYLLKPHPDNLAPGESKEATICYTIGDTCCGKTQQIMIKKCKGFFIYKLPRACIKRARYCGNGGQEKPDCDEKELLLGLTKKYAAKSCKEIKEKRKDAESGVYWIKPGGHPVQAYCDQATDGGGWTLVYSYTFTNFKSFRSGSNAIIPRPTWPITVNYPGNVYPSTTPPKSETDYNAMDFNLWNDLGHEFMVKSTINHWIACQEGSGSLVDFKQGNLHCRIIKNIAVKCHNYVPDQLILHSAGNPAGSTLGPDLIRSQSTSRLKEYYYFESNTRTGNWPTHDPCGTNGLNHLTQVNAPRGNIYIRE